MQPAACGDIGAASKAACCFTVCSLAGAFGEGEQPGQVAGSATQLQRCLAAPVHAGRACRAPHRKGREGPPPAALKLRCLPAAECSGAGAGHPRPAAGTAAERSEHQPIGSERRARGDQARHACRRGRCHVQVRIGRAASPPALLSPLQRNLTTWLLSCRLLMACIQAGLDPHGAVIPAYIQAIFAGQASGIDSSGSRRSAQAWVDWRAQCRRYEWDAFRCMRIGLPGPQPYHALSYAGCHWSLRRSATCRVALSPL